MSARTRRSLALSWSALFVLSLLLQYFSFAVASPVAAAAGAPVVTLEDGVNGCNGVRPTPGSENTDKRLVGGTLVPGGTATFEISYPVDPADVAGRTTFVITDCVFVDGTARLKYSVSFVPNTENYILTFSLVIPSGTPIGAEYCNYAKTTAAPSQSQASNRKAGPACFTVGGNISVLKVNEAGDPLAGATFHIVCTLPTTTSFLPDTIINGESIASTSGGTITRDKTTGSNGRIVIQAPVGTSCVITETAAPSGYQIAADPSVTLVATAAGVDHTFVNTVPKTKPDLSTQVRSGSAAVTTADVGDVVFDRATLDATGGNGAVTGQVDFFVCFNATTKVECTASNATSVSAGANKAVSGTPGIANSDGVTLNAAGFYCFRAAYDPNGNTHYLATSHSNTTTECVQALAGDLHISKTADDASVNAGDTIGYTITLTNGGAGTAHGVKVSDTVPTIPGGFTWTIDSDPLKTVGTWTLSAGVLSFGGASGVDLAAGATVKVHITSPTSSANCGTINNSAAARSTNDGSPSVGPVAIVVNCGDLHISKTADDGSVNAGDSIGYTVTISNSGAGTAHGVKVTDTVPTNAGLTWAIDAAGTTGTWTLSNGVLSFGGANGVDLAPAATFHVHLTSPTSSATCGTVNNSAAASSTNDGSPSVGPVAIVVNCADLDTVKLVATNGGAFGPTSTAQPGDILHYQIKISNLGAGKATGVPVSDDIAAILAHATYNADCSNSCSVNGTTLTWSIASIAAQGSVTLTFSVTLNGTFPTGTTHLPNIVVVTGPGSNCAQGSADTSCDTDTTVTAAPNLAYLKQVSTSTSGPWSSSNTANPGDSLFYKITISNSGNANAANQTVKDVLSQALVDKSNAFNTATCSPACTYDAATRTITWTGVDINSGASVNLTFSVSLKNTFPTGQTSLGNTVVCPLVNEQANLNCTTTTIVSAAPVLNLDKEVSVNGGAYSHSGSAQPGDTLTYRLTITNTGDANATGESVTDNLASVLAHAAWNDDASASSGTTSFVAPNLTWSGISVSAHGGTATVTFSVTLSTGGWTAGTTHLPNAAVEANSENCPNAQSTNADCSTDTTITTGTDLRITKAVEPSTIGGGLTSTVGYTIVVSNQGTGATNGNVLVKDTDFPAFYAISGVICAPANGTCDVAHLTGAGIDLGSLTGGASVTITVSGSAAPNNTTDVGPHTNTASACEQVIEGQAICVDASAVLTVTLTPHPAIHVVKSASASSLPFPGGPVTYTYAVTNTGNVPLSNVTLTDDKCATVAFLGGDTDADNKLDLTETWSYSCTMSITVTTTNIATATGQFGDTTVQDTDTKTVQVGLASSLVIDKSVTGNTGGTDPDLEVPAANIGDTLTYDLHYTGSGPLTAAVITDALPQGLEFVAGSAHGNTDFGDGVYDSATRTITWNASAADGALPNPSDGTLTYQVKVLSTAPDFAQPLMNLASIDSAETAPDSGTASVAVLGPVLGVTSPPRHVTPPPTSTLTPETAPSNPGFTLMLLLLGMAGLVLGIGFITPAPERVRRRDRLG